MHIYPVSKEEKLFILQILDKKCFDEEFEENHAPIVSSCHRKIHNDIQNY